VVSRILAFRPPTVVARLAPRSGACPLSGRELVRPAAELRLALPVVRVPDAAVARGALVAAKELQSALVLALPPGVGAARWFDGVTRAADEVAAGLPLVLSAEVVVEGEGATQLERANDEAWRLSDAGLTQLAFDVAAIAPAERGRVLAQVAAPVSERGIAVEVVVPLGEGAQSAPRAGAMLEEMGRAGTAVDVASVRCRAPADDAEARLQAVALARLWQALAGVPLMRRGPSTPRAVELLRGSPVRLCEDGGAVAGRASAAALPSGEAGPGDGERREALAYAEAIDFMERLGAAGSALAVARALERGLEDR
jgi:hypothetical protein